MEAAGWGMRECSVRLWRCDFDGRGHVVRVDKSVPVGSLKRMTPVAQAADHVGQRGCAVKILGIKVEADCEGTVVKQEPDEEQPHLWWDTVTEPYLHVTESYSKVLKIKDETDETTIIQELEIGPMVLQSRTHTSLDMLNVEACPTELRSSTSSEVGATPGPLCATFGRQAPQTDVEFHHCEGDARILSTGSFVLDFMETDNAYHKVLREQSNDCCNSEDMSTATREYSGKRYERDYRKHSTTRETTFGRQAPQTDVEFHHCEGDAGVSSTGSFVLDFMETDNAYQKVLREQCNDRCNNGDLSTGTREYSGKRYERDHRKNSTTRETALVNPIRTNVHAKPYKCKPCNFGASHISALKRHLRTHMGDEPYKCEQCEFSTPQLFNLETHMRIHTGEKPFECDQCEYSASQVAHLKTHMRTHTGEKPYKCEQCEYSASQLGNLKKHMHIHTGEKPFKCDQCEYSASQLGNLKTHMRTHTGEKPSKCEQCDFGASVNYK